ncbi:tyrosine-type recombinase/integrase [Hyphomicrobium sp. MC8b]|uniref:tyrosine-type recombinase/integrase n=1 Tax=Hyphomicrobium sp. MC8b TaxID=300273 RepID=UPI00391AEE09
MIHDSACITMITPDYNNGNKEEVRATSAIHTLRDLREFIAGCNLGGPKKEQVRSAIKRVDQLIGHGALDLPADCAKIMSKLGQFSPAMAGMTPGAFANLKSRVRTAFRLAKPCIATSNSKLPLRAEWRLFRTGLAVRDLRSTSRLVHFANAQVWSPQDITDGHIERFKSHLCEEALVVKWDDVVRGTIRSWNRIAIADPNQGLVTLTPPEPKRTPYWISPDLFPQSLQAEIARFLSEMSDPPLFGARLEKVRWQARDGRRRPVRRNLKFTTIGQYRNCISTMVSSLVAAGLPLASLSSLSTLVAPRNLEQILRFLHQRAGEKVTPYLLNIAVRARRIAEWSRLPEGDLEHLDQLVAAVIEESPRKRGMTAKNKALLDRLDDPKFRDLIYLMTGMLVERARTSSNRAWAANIFRTAVAIEILLVCGVRRENLVSLELDKTIRKIGAGKNALWIVEIAEGDVKNGEPLRFHLPEESAELLEIYLREWRPLLCKEPSSWLFPNFTGQMLDQRSMTVSIRNATKRILGVPVSTHQFRHISAELYLRNNPEGLSTVSQHLGHRDFNTTRTYYARKQQREASRRYQERVILDRSEAARRSRGRK